MGPRPPTLKAVGGFSEHAAVCESSHQQPEKSVDQGDGRSLRGAVGTATYMSPGGWPVLGPVVPRSGPDAEGSDCPSSVLQGGVLC